MLLLGHRGASRLAPENTIAAFDLALQHGCDGIEFDVRHTSDGRAAICHDPDCHGYMLESSLFSELRAVNPALACMEEILGRYATTAFLYIELKVTGIAKTVIEYLQAYPPQKGFVIASFHSRVLAEVHDLERDIPLGQIAGRARDLAPWPDLPVSYVMPNFRLVTREFVNDSHREGKRVIAWTVNDEHSMTDMDSLGVDGILSDDTHLLCRTFGRT